MEARTVKITVQDRALQIQTTLDQQALDAIVAYSNQRLAEIARAGVTSQHEVALLALLSVVEELVRERENLGALKERIRLKSALILDMLDGGSAPRDPGDYPRDQGPPRET